MAYAAVTSLLQTLDYLLPFPSFIYEIIHAHARQFLTRVQEAPSYEFVADEFPVEICVPTPCSANSERVVSVTEKNFREWRLSPSQITILLNDKTPRLVEKNPPILQELEEAGKLFKVKDWKWDHACWTAMKLDHACWKLMRKIRCFNEFRAWVTFLRQDLLFLLSQLDDSSIRWDDHGLLNCTRDVCLRARDIIKESMVDKRIERAMTSFIDKVFEMNFPQINVEADYIQNVIKDLFCGEKDIQRILFETLEQILVLRRTAKDVIGEMQSSESPRISTKQETVVGLEDEQLKIMEALTGMPRRLEFLTIVGMGGIGKTTLARKLFNDPYTVHHFDCQAWITISQAYRLRDLLLGLLSSFAQRSDGMMEKSDAQLTEDLYRILKGKKYLIVMDDLWSTDAWIDVKRCFPDDKIGSRIIVTSRSTEVANYVSPRRPPHLMNLLDIEKSWELLEKMVFGIASCPTEMVDVGKQIAKRCGGLPLAIAVIAGILSRNIKAPDSWKHIAENLSSVVSTDPEQCIDILALSYIYLPHHLRACFLYMGAFPEDCEIEAQKLINLWMAEGFIFTDHPNTVEEIAEDYLEELIGRNLVLVEKRSFGGKVKSCRLHDFIRELCLREAQKENFMSVVQKPSSMNFPAGMRKKRRLSFHLDPYSDVPAAPRVAQILSLIHLTYLGLNVTFELPATMSQLRNLQTFNMQGPWSRQESGSSPILLLEYWRMPSLRHLQTSAACQLRSPPINPPRLFALEYLQTLSKITYASCREEIFIFMPHLKRLRICETEEDYNSDRSCDLLNNLVYLQELETLKCCFYTQTLEARRLSCLGAFPSSLRQLSLSSSYLSWEDMATIAILPNLQVLKLKNYAFHGPSWEPTEGGFTSLQHLLIKNTNLVHWEATVHHFPLLQKLILKSCKHLVVIPFGVEEIGSLQQFEVHYCSEPIEILGREIQEQVEGVEVVIRSDR